MGEVKDMNLIHFLEFWIIVFLVTAAFLGFVAVFLHGLDPKLTFSESPEYKIALAHQQRKLAEASFGGTICFKGTLGSFPCHCIYCTEEMEIFMKNIANI